MNNESLLNPTPLTPHPTNVASSRRSQASYTDQRVQEIKKKYSTPKRPRQTSVQPRAYTSYGKENEPQSAAVSMSQPRQSTPTPITHSPFYPSGDLAPQITNSSLMKRAMAVNRSHGPTHQYPDRTSALGSHNRLGMKYELKQKLQSQAEQQPIFKGYRLPSEYPLRERQHKPYHDPRIDSIDQINSKIKRILDKIDVCEQEENFAQDVHDNFSHSNIAKEAQPVAYSRINDRIDNNIIDRPSRVLGASQERPYDHAPLVTEFATSQAVQAHSRILGYSRPLRSSTLPHQDASPQYQPVDSRLKPHQMAHSALKASSCYGGMRKSGLSGKGTLEEMDQKVEHVSGQINRFHKKIAQLQDYKRNLNIKFKPYSYERSSQHRVKTEHNETTTSKFFKTLPSQEWTASKSLQRTKQLQLQLSREKSTALLRFVNDRNHADSDKLSHLNNFLTMHKETVESEQPKWDGEELRRQIGTGMQERKRIMERLGMSPKKGKNLIAEFVKTLSEQVQLDQNLRNAKNWFSESHLPNKVEALKGKLQGKGVIMSSNQIQSEFLQINDDETDPFFSFREENFTLDSVVDCYISSSSFWLEQLKNRWNVRQMVGQEGLNDYFFNQDKLVIEDLVRLLNMILGKFYRNRDLFAIYERVKHLSGPGTSTVEAVNRAFGQK